MPSLPDKEALGGLPSMRTGRYTPSAGDAKADVSGQEASTKALVTGFESLAGRVEKVAAEEVQQQDALDLIRANAAHTERLRDIGNSFDTDPDWQTYRPRFADAATQAAADASAGIKNASLRTRWIEQANERNSAAMDRVLDRGTRLQKEAKEIEVDKVLDQYRRAYESAPDDLTRRRVLADIDATVTAAQRTGLLDMSRGEGKRRSAVDEMLRSDAERRLLAGDSVGLMRDLGAIRDPNAKPARAFKPVVQVAINDAASKHDVDADLLSTVIRIESSGDPSLVTGSYKGAGQLSEEQFRKFGGKGSIFDPAENISATALKLKAESASFEDKYGRPPTAAEIYMIHQQGAGGADAHWRNPDRPAWQNMASTAEGRQKGEAWAKKAIWGNVPDDVKAEFGSVENITSGQFTQMWADKVERIGGAGGGGVAAGPYSRMSFAARHALMTRSKIAMSAETQHDLRDAVQDLIDTGEMRKGPDGSTALDRARMFLQPNQVKRAELQIEEARSIHEAVSPLRGMTEREAVEHVQRFQDPRATGDRAAMSRRVSRAAEAAWAEIQEERRSDPVEAVDPFTNVRTQKAGRTRRGDEVSGAYDLIKRRMPGVEVRQTMAGGFEIMDPPAGAPPEVIAETHKARAALIEARIEAQAKLGIPRDNRRPISKREADALLDLPENVNTLSPADYRVRLQAAADRAERTYGKQMGPVVLEAALSFRKTGDSDHKDQAERLVRRLTMGQPVSSTDIRRLNDLQDLERRRMVFDQPSMADFERGRSMPMPMPMPQSAPAPGRPTPRASAAESGSASTAPTLPARPEPAMGVFSRPAGPTRSQRGSVQRQQAPANPFDEDDDQR